MERVNWNKYEEALLIEAYLKIHDVSDSDQFANAWKEITEKLSSDLRQYAERLGLEITEKYRNTTGISMKLQNIRFLYTDGREGLSNFSQLDSDMVWMEKVNKNNFNEVLNKAKETILPEKHEKNIHNIIKHQNNDLDEENQIKNAIIQTQKIRRHCCLCNKPLRQGQGRAINTYKGLLYMCDECSSDSSIEEAFKKEAVGTKKQGDYSIKIAFELESWQNEVMDWLMYNGFKKVSYNNKTLVISPNWNGLAPISKLLIRVDELVDAGKLSISGYAPIFIGISNDINEESIKELEGYILKLFCNISEIFRNMQEEKQILTLGCKIPEERYFNDNKDRRNALIQIYKNNYLKLSTCKYINREQYLFLVKIFRKVAVHIIDYNKKTSNIDSSQRSSLEKKYSYIFCKKFKKELNLLYNQNGLPLKRYDVNNRNIYKFDCEDNIKKNYPDIYMRLRSMSKVYDNYGGLSIDWIQNGIGVDIDKSVLRNIMTKLSWVYEIDDDIYSFSEHKSKTKKNVVFNKDEFINILITRYKGGMNFDSIDLENFREFYNETYSKSLDLSDEELEQCIRNCGIMWEERLFPAECIINESVKEKLLLFIRNVFDSERKVLYYKAIYNELLDDFANCFNLASAKMLKLYLEYVCDTGEFFFFDEYMSKDKSVLVDHSKEIEKFMLSQAKPVSYEEMYLGLSHISKEVIKREARRNQNILTNGKESYFHYNLFEFSSVDADEISGFINEEIEEEGYCIWSRVYKKIIKKMPLFMEQNTYLSSIGIRNAVSKKLLGRFNFEGEVICRSGQSLNMAKIYHLYGKHHVPFSDRDISEFSKEISGGIIYFDSLADTTIRVSKTLFIAREQIKFDVDSIDKALSTYITTGYMLIKDVDSFLVFPNVEYEWNIFLLESYLMYYSRDYLLCNNGKSLNNVAGALVKKESGYDDFEDICADALANGYIDLTKESALDYLTKQNLLTRRSYANIEKAIAKAKQIRNRKE